MPDNARPNDEERMSPSQWLADSEVAMTNRTAQAQSAWEYLIVSLPSFGPARTTQGQSASVSMLNHEGQKGWEAVGMTALDDGTVAVLLKRPARPGPTAGMS